MTERKTLPEGEIEQFCDELQGSLEGLVKKVVDDIYGEILYNVQDYLKSNATHNISSAFDAVERERINTYKCLGAILDSQTLGEAKNNARAALKGYWTPAKTEEYRNESKQLSVMDIAKNVADASGWSPKTDAYNRIYQGALLGASAVRGKDG